MQLRLSRGLPFVQVEITFRNQSLILDNIIVDTGSARSVFSVDKLAVIRISPEGEDRLRKMRGVGGVEYVFSKRIERLTVGSLVVEDLAIHVGAVNYGFGIDGLLGMDFLRQVDAVIDLAHLEIRT